MELLYENKRTKLLWGDALELIDSLPDNEIQACITSPTYWGKRSFTDDKKEFGSEPLEDYVKRNVLLYTKILEKMKNEGSLFVVIQDSYMGSGISRTHHNHWEKNLNPEYVRDGLDAKKQGNTSSVTARHGIIKNKSLCGIPFRIAINVVDQGYIWRELIIWEKPNPMPSNVTDRVRQSCEYILHFTKKGKYKFNSEHMQVEGKSGKLRMENQVLVASPEPHKGHTATFPRKIVERLLLAVTDPGDLVFEPFLGSGTMHSLSMIHNRKFIGIDICRDFVEDLVCNIQGIGLNEANDKQRGLEQFISPQRKEISIKTEKRIEYFDAVTRKIINFIQNQNDEMQENPIKCFQNPILRHKTKKYQFKALFVRNGMKIAFEIPSMRNFDDPSTGLFYAAKRLREAISLNLISMGILLVPKNIKGGKFQQIVQEEKGMHVIKFSEDIASRILRDQDTEHIDQLTEIKEVITL